MCDVEIDISGPDADYADAFPTNVPARPSWVEPVNATCRSLLPLTGGDPATKVTVYQAFPPDTTIAGAEDGKLGELDPFRDAGETGSWLIVDWVPVGKGAYVTSDECGVRLRSGDVTLEAVDDPYSYDELWADGDLAEIEGPQPLSRRLRGHTSSGRPPASLNRHLTYTTRDGSASGSPMTTRTRKRGWSASA